MTTPSDQNQSTENTPTPPQTGPENTPTPPPTPPPVQNTPANTGNQNPSFTEVMNGLNALPEKIVHSLREAMQPQTPPKTEKTETQQSQSQTQTQTQTQTDGTVKAPGKKSFGEWWFGR